MDGKVNNFHWSRDNIRTLKCKKASIWVDECVHKWCVVLAYSTAWKSYLFVILAISVTWCVDTLIGWLVLNASYLWWDGLPLLSQLLMLLVVLLSRFWLGTRITRSYVSRSVELMRHGHFFMNSLQILPRRVELICRCSFECILKAKKYLIYLSSKPCYACMVISVRETWKWWPSFVKER